MKEMRKRKPGALDKKIAQGYVVLLTKDQTSVSCGSCTHMHDYRCAKGDFVVNVEGRCKKWKEY